MLEKKPNLGNIKSVYGISPLFMQRAAIVALLSFVFFLLMLLGFYIRLNIGYFLLSTAFLMVYLFAMSGWLMARRQVLTIYERGFTFKKHVCRWEEIDAIEGKTENRSNGGAKINFEIRKTDGEKIYLTETICDVEKAVDIIGGKASKNR